MALVCISGAKECTACRKCFSASVCEICGKTIPEGRIYYELSEEKVCSDCVEFIIADGEEVCSLCGDTMQKYETALIFEEHLLCPYCTKLAEKKKYYV
ncbi:MAG: hypothetical protein IKL36_03360 [Clostridia bacterium]|nr:hypothetical protein [Clostridia bacterium]